MKISYLLLAGLIFYSCTQQEKETNIPEDTSIPDTSEAAISNVNIPYGSWNRTIHLPTKS